MGKLIKNLDWKSMVVCESKDIMLSEFKSSNKLDDINSTINSSSTIVEFIGFSFLFSETIFAKSTPLKSWKSYFCLTKYEIELWPDGSS